MKKLDWCILIDALRPLCWCTAKPGQSWRDGLILAVIYCTLKHFPQTSSSKSTLECVHTMMGAQLPSSKDTIIIIIIKSVIVIIIIIILTISVITTTSNPTPRHNNLLLTNQTESLEGSRPRRGLQHDKMGSNLSICFNLPVRIYCSIRDKLNNEILSWLSQLSGNYHLHTYLYKSCFTK